MTEHLSLAQVLRLLPPSSGARLWALQARGVVVACQTQIVELRANNVLIALWPGGEVRTRPQPWIAPELVEELVALVEAQFGRQAC